MPYVVIYFCTNRMSALLIMHIHIRAGILLASIGLQIPCFFVFFYLEVTDKNAVEDQTHILRDSTNAVSMDKD